MADVPEDANAGGDSVRSVVLDENNNIIIESLHEKEELPMTEDEDGSKEMVVVNTPESEPEPETQREYPEALLSYLEEHRLGKSISIANRQCAFAGLNLSKMLICGFFRLLLYPILVICFIFGVGQGKATKKANKDTKDEQAEVGASDEPVATPSTSTENTEKSGNGDSGTVECVYIDLMTTDTFSDLINCLRYLNELGEKAKALEVSTVSPMLDPLSYLFIDQNNLDLFKEINMPRVTTLKLRDYRGPNGLILAFPNLQHLEIQFTSMFTCHLFPDEIGKELEKKDLYKSCIWEMIPTLETIMVINKFEVFKRTLGPNEMLYTKEQFEKIKSHAEKSKLKIF